MSMLRSVVHDLKAVLMPYLLPTLNFFYMPGAYGITAVPGEGIPIIGSEKATGDVDTKIHTYTATALGKHSPTLGNFYPRESPGTHFIEG